MVIEDGASFRTPQHKGFLQCVAKWMEIAIDLGYVPDADTLKSLSPSHTTVSNGIRVKYDEFKKVRDQKLKTLAEKDLFAVISTQLDLWTDKGFKHHSLGDMATVLNEDKVTLEEICLGLVDWEELVKSQPPEQQQQPHWSLCIAIAPMNVCRIRSLCAFDP